jgi:hypothetical protein
MWVRVWVLELGKIKLLKINIKIAKMAEEEGFEPSIGLHL